MNDEIGEIVGVIPAYDSIAAEEARSRWDRVAKPAGSLGLLEKAVTRIAGITGDPGYRIDRRALVVCCADNGVARRGVSSADSSVTAMLARTLVRGGVSVCKMAELAGVDVIGVDMGMNGKSCLPGLVDRRLAAGSDDMTEGPAMSRDLALQGIRHGVRLAEQCRDRGYKILATGELGIANTTTSSAVAAVLLDRQPAEVAGPGTGLSDDGVRRKAAVIARALAVNRPDPGDPVDVLAKLGGFDIAGLAGVFLGCAACRLPVIVDGLISSVAALVAKRLRPEAGAAMLASHVSAEPAAGWVLDALELRPLIAARMCLGEGSGAVAVLPLLDMAYHVYNGAATYDELLAEAPGREET